MKRIEHNGESAYLIGDTVIKCDPDGWISPELGTHADGMVTVSIESIVECFTATDQFVDGRWERYGDAVAGWQPRLKPMKRRW